VLTVSSYPSRTSPVIRGKYVLQNILGTPPEPPPGDIPPLEEAAAAGGFGSAVLEALAEAGVAVPVHCLAIPDRVVEHGDPAAIRAALGLDADGIARAARRLLGG
jgi:hypothetical protein